MERSRKILRKIASASHQVITAANEYADRKDLFNVERVHFQLEEEMQKISVACEYPSYIAFSTSPHIGPNGKDAPVRTSTGLTVRSMSATRNKIDEAVSLLDSRKRCFHFLFATDIWSNERGVQQLKDTSHSRDDSVQVQRECNVVEERLRPRMNHNTTLRGIAAHHIGDAITERSPETKVDEEKKEEGKNIICGPVSHVSPGREGHLNVMSQPLRNYMLDYTPDHFGHLGPQIESILHDIKMVERDT
ncbi:hypothetical protein OG21DRAFT_1487740 [Imleria badia]|nr:hypothetical protein OG21DRAFT_1487740 [Imleria badia]